MEILFDTADLVQIAELADVYPISGVTCNPTIIKAEGAIDFYPHFRKLREAIGADRSLHIQVIATDTTGMVRDAHRLLENIDPTIHVKVPVTEQGLQAIQLLKRDGVKVTATTVFSKIQGILAIAAGADYIAPYFNRMESLDIDITSTIETLAHFIDRQASSCKILAASFKNVAQVSAAFDAGAHAVTLPPHLLRTALASRETGQAIKAFSDDWRTTFGTDALP
jgi:TalC/MipB family fructose-6-phosphate aldolase